MSHNRRRPRRARLFAHLPAGEPLGTAERAEIRRLYQGKLYYHGGLLPGFTITDLVVPGHTEPVRVEVFFNPELDEPGYDPELDEPGWGYNAFS